MDVDATKNPSPAAASHQLSSASPHKTREGEEVRAPAKSSSSSSSAELFDRLIQIPAKHQSQPEAQRKLTPSEFLEFLSKQGTTTVPGSNDYQSVAIDQCDITSPVDYGSRDYYRPSTLNSDAPAHIRKPNELDELYKTSTDTRGNWWEGSFHY